MGIGASFQVLSELPPEQALGLASAALRDGDPGLQAAAFDFIAGTGRLQLLLLRYPSLPPELRQRMARDKDRYVPAALELAQVEREVDRRAGLVALAAIDPFGTAAAVAKALDDPSVMIRETAAALLDDLGMRYYYHLVASRLHGDAESLAYLERHRAGMLELLVPVLRLYPRHERKVFLDIAIEAGADTYPLIADFILFRRETSTRRAFLQALVSSSTEQAVRLLFRLASERDPRLRDAALEVMRQRKDAGFPALVASVLSKLPGDEQDALAGKTTDLPWWPSAEALPALDAVSSARLLEFAARSAVAPERRDERIRLFLRSPYPEVRLRVLSLLQVLEHPQFAAIAEGALDDPADEVKLAAARAIIGLNPPNKAKLLLPLLNAPSEELRRLAMREVASASLDRYLKAFDKLDPQVRETAAKAIAKIDGRITERLADEIGSLDPDRRLVALRVVDVLDAEEGLRESVFQLLVDPDRRVRATALRVLQAAREGEGLRLLTGALGDADRRVRANAVEAFEDSGDARCVPILLPLLEDPDNRVRANAAKALLRYGRPEGRAALEAMLRHADPVMRLSAAWTLGQARFEGVESLLQERARVETNLAVREKLADALAGLRGEPP